MIPRRTSVWSSIPRLAYFLQPSSTSIHDSSKISPPPAEEMADFTATTAQLLGERKVTLIDDIDSDNCTEAELMEWLELAIDNMHQCMHDSAKLIWGETNQSRILLARSVSIKYSNRCTAQLQKARLLVSFEATTVVDIVTAMNAVIWPRWVLYPDQLVSGCAHASVTGHLVNLLRRAPTTPSVSDWYHWVIAVYKQWRCVIRIRRNWRQTQIKQRVREQRRQWFNNGEMKQFLNSTLGRATPPVTIRSAILGSSEGQIYSEDRGDVQNELKTLLDNWIPADERTEPPRYLDTLSPEDANMLPEFAREWILPDIQSGGRFAAYWRKPENTWNQYRYTREMQADVDKQLKQHVAPGYGGISQEMWVAAPEAIRARERRVIEPILRIGKAPPILRRKQMIFLPKTKFVDPTLDNSKGLPPWRPITVQSAFASRLFLVVKRYVEPGIPISVMQHGFQTDRTVIDAVLLVTLLTERALDLKEQLIMVSKACLKCFDRIPKWCMDLIYRGIGVPDTPRKLMIDLLGPGQIDDKALSSRSCILRAIWIELAECPDPVQIRHNQVGNGINVSSTLFVDDQLDVTTSEAGMQARAHITNIFTGKLGTGGVFGAAKSFMMYLATSESHFQAVQLNDGLSIPRPVQIVSPVEGFKHLGIFQGGCNQWEATITPVWAQITEEAFRVQHLRLSASQFRYIVNSVWVPRMRYRLILGGAFSVAGFVHTFIRQVARTVLRLPFSTPRNVFYDTLNGLGLESCETDANVHRCQEALRILNTPSLPVYHLLVERLERYQINAGLPDNPLAIPIKPPAQVQTWEAQLFKFAAKLEPPLKCAVQWTQPPQVVSRRSSDQTLLSVTDPTLQHVLVAVNWNSQFKLIFVGDISSEFGNRILSRAELQVKGRWTGAKANRVDELYNHWKSKLVTAGTLELRHPVGCDPITPGMTPYQMRIGTGQWIVAVKLDSEASGQAFSHYELDSERLVT